MVFSGEKYVLSCIKNALLKEFPPRRNELLQVLKILMIILKGERHRRLSERVLGIKIPKTVILSVTRRCNLSCRGCYAVNSTDKYQLSTADIQRIIKEAIHLGSYYFIIAGGEPLMIPDLIPLLAKNKSALFIMITNGTLLNEKLVSELKKSQNILPVISLDGNQEQVDERRGTGTWQKLQFAMNLLRIHHVVFGISLMITHLNLRRVLTTKWMNSIWKNGARFGFILDYLPFNKSHHSSYNLNIEDFLIKRKLLADLRIKSPLRLFTFPEGAHCKSECFFLKDQLIHINANGMVEPCPFCQVATENIREKPLEMILQSDFFKTLHQEFPTQRHRNDSCILFGHEEKIKTISAGIQKSASENVHT